MQELVLVIVHRYRSLCVGIAASLPLEDWTPASQSLLHPLQVVVIATLQKEASSPTGQHL